MAAPRPLTARPAARADRLAIQTLARCEPHVHAHLDWRPVEDWIGQPPFWVAEQGPRLVGALACPPDLPAFAWLRLFAAADGLDPAEVWDALWPPARAELARLGPALLAALCLEPWSEPLYQAAGFTPLHDVVVLRRPPAAEAPAAPPPPGVRLRPAEPHDLAAIIQADTQAFAAPWQLAPDMIRLALDQAEYVSVAEVDGAAVGYQLTTPSRAGAHLARLAVRPDQQGRGLGRALVADLINYYRRRGGREITVNTQHDNAASLSVYHRLGFQNTETHFRVYVLAL